MRGLFCSARGGDFTTRRGRFFASLFLCTAAVATDADDTQQVLCHFKFVFGGHRILNRFQFSRIEFDDLAAFGTDHVIVVLVLVVVFIVRATVAETNFARQARIGQQLQGAIHRRVPDTGIFLLHEPIQILTGKVLLGAQKHVENQVPLGRSLKALPLNVLKKYLLLFGHRCAVGTGIALMQTLPTKDDSTNLIIAKGVCKEHDYEKGTATAPA
jgi:hypothetical protein